MGGWELSELYLKCRQMWWRCQWWWVWSHVSCDMRTWGSHVTCGGGVMCRLLNLSTIFVVDVKVVLYL